MAKKQVKRISDEIRSAIENCGMTRYRIAKQTGIDAAVLCRFVQGQVGLSMDSLDRLAELLDLHIVVGIPKSKKGG
jgi:ribosome-binding protein aMBF1 (putative translation factor)